MKDRRPVVPVIRSRRWIGGILLALLLGASLPAQPGEHERRVHIGKGRWVTPAEATAKGYFFYRDRWLPKKLEPRLDRWERQDKKVKTWRDAYRVKSKHYRIKTNAPRYIAELELKPFMDELYRTYVKVFKQDFGLKGRAADKNHIHVYWGYPTWKANENSDRGSPGYYQPGEQLSVMYDPTDVDDFYNTVFHEGAHQFFQAMLPGAKFPIWLDEALAVYFEGCTFSPSTLTITADHMPVNRLDDAKQLIQAAQAAGRPVTPQALFMEVHEDKFGASEYALAWSFLHYLIHRDGGKHKKDVYKFLKEMNGSGAKPVHRVFKEATKKKLEDIEKGWVPFVLGLKSPPQPERQVLTPKNAGSLDVKKGDQLDRIDGHRIYSEADWQKYWVNRDTSKPVKLLLIRSYDKKGPMDYQQKFVTVVVPPNSKLVLDSNDTIPFIQNVIE